MDRGLGLGRRKVGGEKGVLRQSICRLVTFDVLYLPCVVCSAVDLLFLNLF